MMPHLKEALRDQKACRKTDPVRARRRQRVFYVASLSCKTIVYNGMLLAGQVEKFYTDLADPQMETSLAMVHSRYSTNNIPKLERAHPNRYIIHNGEINTLRGNINWMFARQSKLASDLFGDDLKKIFPVISQDGSDSAMFDKLPGIFISCRQASFPCHDDDDPRTMVQKRNHEPRKTGVL